MPLGPQTGSSQSGQKSPMTWGHSSLLQENEDGKIKGANSEQELSLLRSLDVMTSFSGGNSK